MRQINIDKAELQENKRVSIQIKVSQDKVRKVFVVNSINYCLLLGFSIFVTANIICGVFGGALD